MQDQEPEKTAKYLRVKVVDHIKEGHPAVNIKVRGRTADLPLTVATARVR